MKRLRDFWTFFPCLQRLTEEFVEQPKGGSLNKSSCSAPALGVFKFVSVCVGVCMGEGVDVCVCVCVGVDVGVGVGVWV